ncbi:MAG: MBL fold metallo-hydrolase [Thermoplasmatota archaeon]
MTPRIMKVGGRGWDCNQFLLKDPSSNAYDLVDAGHGLDFDAVLAEISAVVDPNRIRTVAITHEHYDHVTGIPKWQSLGASVVAAPAAAEKLSRGHDPTSEMFGRSIPTVEVDVVDEGDRVRLGGTDFETLVTPGHSPGSACYWNASSGVLFTGDTIFANGGIGRFDFPDGNVQELAESILRLESLPAKVLHCGHGACVQEGARDCLRQSLGFVNSCL